jgi:WD40 repeat protein
MRCHLQLLMVLIVACNGLIVRAAEEKKSETIPIAKLARKAPVDFEREVLPILKSSCLACHNKTTTKGELNLESPQTILKGGESGPAVKPKRSADSLLLKLASHAAKPRMPPRDNKAAAADLTPEELGVLKLWIDQGAKPSTHLARPIEWQPLPEGLKPIFAVALTADGQFVACSRANQIFLYHLPTGQLVTRLTDPALYISGSATFHGVAHRDLVQSLAFSPDGMQLVSGSYREVKIWRRPAITPTFILKTTAGKPVTALAATPNGNLLATGAEDGSVKLWDLSNGKLAKSLGISQSPISTLRFEDERLTKGVNSQAKVASDTSTSPGWLSAHFKNNASRSWHLTFTARGDLNSIKEGIDVSSLEPSASVVRWKSMVPSWTNQFVLGGGADGLVRVYGVDDKPIRELNHGAPITDATARRNGKRIASAGGSTVKLWDAMDGKLIANLKGERFATELVVERERSFILATNEVVYRKATLKSAETNLTALVERVKKATETNSAAVKLLPERKKSTDEAGAAKAEAEKAVAEFKGEAKDKKPLEDKLAAAAKTLTDAEAALKKAEQAKSQTEHELELATTANRKAEQTLAEEKRGLELAEKQQQQASTDLETARKSAMEAEKPIRAVAFSPDNLLLATADEAGLVHLWSAETGAAIDTLKGHSGAVNTLTFATKDTLASGGADGNVLVWKLNVPWFLERTLGTGGAGSPLADRVNAVRFSPDGRMLATGGGEPSRGGEILLWQAATGRLVQTLTNVHSDTVFSLDFSRDGKLLASGAADKFMRVTELSSGKVVKTFEGHTHHVLCVSWKRDGRTLASAGADNVVKVWDFLTGERRKNIDGYGKEVTSVQFVGITDQAITSAGDARVRLVRDNGTEVRSFTGAADFVYAAAATPDGNLVVAGGQDGVLRSWNGTNGAALFTFEPPIAKTAPAKTAAKE